MAVNNKSREPLLDPRATDVSTENLGATRRDALRLIGGGAALAALAFPRLSSGATAREATPEVGAESKVGLSVVIRTRTVKPDVSIDELTSALTEGLVPLIREIPGFVEYYVVQNEETLERTGVSIFTDKAGADESTRVAVEFINAEGLSDSYERAEPVVLEGTIVTDAS
jgi:hypothetical protein